MHIEYVYLKYLVKFSSTDVFAPLKYDLFFTLFNM